MPKNTFNLTPQEETVYRSVKTFKKKSGIKTADILDGFPDMSKSRLSDILTHLVEKGALVRLEKRGFYSTI